MSRLKPPDISQDPIERDFLDALDRLINGEPTNKSLKKASAKGVLKITASNVALEACRSRTLISMEKCRYPRVRDLIKQAKAGRTSVPTTHTQLIQRLRADIADLRMQKELYQAEATAHFLARVKAEKEAAREKATSDRFRKELETLRGIEPLVIKA